MTRRVRRRLCKDGGKGKDVAADEERELRGGLEDAAG